ncbi:hypothetical protein [Paraburkholderia strydomiana]|uniref:hypothetical protein n=1 Tax=Paraburkholderia strydomiana TaxID=1245417 RepID=UPI0038B8CFB0
MKIALNRSDMPAARFLVTAGSRRRSSKAQIVHLSQEIRVRPEALAEYCFSKPDALAYDLMTVIGAVTYADLTLVRRHSQGWSRRLELEIPVYDISRWSSSAESSLTHCLNYLTGDIWSFRFVKRQGEVEAPPQDPLGRGLSENRSRVFVPFSHGLDSFAQVRLLQQAEPFTEIVCIRASDRPWKSIRSALRHNSAHSIQYIPVPVSVKRRHHSERSFRTRPFIYYLLAAYGAVLSGNARVMIPENGQGSIGGTLVTTGHEARHRSCYPVFTFKLSQFVRDLTGRDVQFYHPALFETKGRVLKALSEAGEPMIAALHEHFSCSCSARFAYRESRRIHCGICGNCLLRRTAEHFAGISGATEYLFSDLSAETLEGALQDGDHGKYLKFFTDLARNGARDMQRLADLQGRSDRPLIQTTAVDLARNSPESRPQMEARLVALLDQHASEWNAFLAECGERSWISNTARG